MRAFISINLTAAVRDAILRFQKEQDQKIHNIRWTKPDNIHLTLKFLGEVEDQTAETLAQILPPVARQFSPFPLEIAGIGTFPPRGPLSILWMGVKKGLSSLTALEAQIRQAMEAADIPFDKKAFVPHLTIARAIRNRRVFFVPGKEFEEYSFGTMQVEAFHLMESQLLPDGPIYTERIRFEFPFL
ncbi:MAG: RNA 2',3'-cyclic phosphodiesterase [Candidatus Omnitrophota bacterium]|jgi:2'-5' RNA ligase|nr:MAG: RNA 2',3'-cyclic phosphodiesterase [Candidatus Omnitrophota bacterium]